MLALTSAAVAQTQVFITDLGTLGGTYSYAYDISESGVVVGQAQDPSGRSRAFMWTQAGGMVNLDTLGGSSSYASAISENNEIVGRVRLASGDSRAFRWTPTSGMVDLGTLGGTYSSAVDISENGEVAGVARIASGDDHAFLWTQVDGMRDLGTLGGRYSYPADISANGFVVGQASITGDSEYHAALWFVADPPDVLLEIPSIVSTFDPNGALRPLHGDRRGRDANLHGRRFPVHIGRRSRDRLP